ncbi:MAG: glycosyltransferase family 4 protein [Terriglobales bacterium]
MDSSHAPRVLLVLPQFPQDTAGGAPRSLTNICEMLVCAGFEVRALAVTASGDTKRKPAEILRHLGIQYKVEERKRPELVYKYRGVPYRVMDVSGLPIMGWENVYGRHFDAAFDEELRSFQPDVLFTYGGTDADRRRFQRAQNSGAKVVFGLRNEYYLSTYEWHRHIDAFLTPSNFLSDLYRREIGIESVGLPTPMELTDVVADEHDPIFLTVINPSPEKGVTLIATLAEELSKRRPDIPILIIESRGGAGLLASVGELGGFDLRRHENIMFSPSVPQPKDIYAPTRVLMAPSLWQEAGGRIVGEALVNGIPPLVSDRGALSEYAGGAGYTFHVPEEITPARREPLPSEVVQPWIDVIIRMFDDEEFYRAECEKARTAARKFLPETLAPEYVKFFREIIANN